MIKANEHKEFPREKTLLQNTLDILREKRKLLIYSSLVFFLLYTFLYGLWKIPFIKFGINRSSPVTGNDLLFLLVISILAAMFIALWKYEKHHKLTSGSAVGGAGGAFGAIFAAVCPVCQSIGVVALGVTLLNIPTAFLTPYLGILKIVSLGIMGLAVLLKADSIHTQKCRSCIVPSPSHKLKKKQEPLPFRNNFAFGLVSAAVILLFINQLLIPQAFASVAMPGERGSATLGSFEYGSKITLKPMPLAHGESPKISGYKTSVKPLPTISELALKPTTGDPVQDLLNNIIPTGTPWYGQQAGVTFDDPIASQNKWATYRGLQLSPSEQERWNRIANSFTCDYCCGSPQNPTIITRCGCAHAAAAQGMTKWLIKNYGSSYSDEEIYGEMARWYALWYPKGTIERIIQESQ